MKLQRELLVSCFVDHVGVDRDLRAENIWNPKTVEQCNSPALALLVAVELLFDHANHDIVADQTARIHDLLGLDTERGLLSDLGSQHVTGSLRNERIHVRESKL